MVGGHGGEGLPLGYARGGGAKGCAARSAHTARRLARAASLGNVVVVVLCLRRKLTHDTHFGSYPYRP